MLMTLVTVSNTVYVVTISVEVSGTGVMSVDATVVEALSVETRE